MSDKKTNEILEAQRKAQQSFLELKKMQKGEMYAGPKPSETATVLKTPKEKFANFWHYSKWYVIATVAIVALIVFMVAQCVSKPKYDLKVVYFTYTPALDELTEPIAEYIEKYAEDIDGDGKVNVQIINCSVSDGQGSVMNRNTTLQKLQSILVAEESALLFITDEKADAYFENMSEGDKDFFYNTVKLDENFYKEVKTKEAYGTLPEGLSLSCRKIEETVLEDEDDAEKYYDVAKDIVEKIKKEQDSVVGPNPVTPNND